jgi:transposase
LFGRLGLDISPPFRYATVGKEKPVSQNDSSLSLEHIPDEAWPFPFPRSDWEQVPPSVQAFILTLVQRIEALEAKLSENSQNSSRPPSSDSPYRKPRTKTKAAKKSKRRRGARKGHKGSRQVLLDPTEVVDVHPSACSCGCTDMLGAEPYYTHQHIELPEIRLDVTHLHLYQGSCARCGRVVKARLDQLPASERVGFGPRLTALVGLLSGVVGVGRRDTQRLLRSVLGLSVSLSAIQTMIDRMSRAIRPHYEAIGERVHTAPVNHVDETSWRCQAVLQWLWVLANRTTAYFQIRPGRTKKDFLALIGVWKGILVSDDYGCYRAWVNLHQTCLAHLIRRAQKLAEAQDPEPARFGASLKAELQLMCAWAQAPPSVPEWNAHYMRLVKLLFRHNERSDDAGKLARALVRQLDNLWVYLEHNAVDPTNNLAERVLRFLVIRRKVSGGTQSEKGNRWIERIASLRETCRLRGQRSYPILVDAIRSLFEGRAPDLNWLSSP